MDGMRVRLRDQAQECPHIRRLFRLDTHEARAAGRFEARFEIIEFVYSVISITFTKAASH